MISKEKIQEKIDNIDWNAVGFWVAIGAALGTGVYFGHLVGWYIGWNNGGNWMAKAIDRYGMDVARPLAETSLTGKDLVKIFEDPELNKFVKALRVVK